MSTTALIFSIFVFLFSQFAIATPMELDCKNQIPSVSVEEFSKKYLNADFVDLPFFLKSWLSQTVDTNNNLIVDSEESQKVSCLMSESLKTLVTQTKSEYVSSSGVIDAYSFWANDTKISSYEEFRIALGEIALQWLPQFISEIQPVNSEQIIGKIKSGLYLVTEPEIANQWDLSGTDQNPLSIRLKALDLAYEISRLITLVPLEQLKPSLNALFQELLRSNNFPYTLSVKDSQSQITLSAFINMYGLGGIGVPGVQRYYVMEKLSLQIVIDANGESKVIWGQPSQQNWFLLRDPKTMEVDSQKFVQRVLQQMENVCELKELPMLSMGDLNSSDDLQNWLKKYYQIFAESFWKEEPEIKVLEDTLEGNSNAYVTEDRQIHFSMMNVLSLKTQLEMHFPEESVLRQLERNLVFIIVQEWVHLLQNETEIYEPNLLFYNNPSQAYLIFGRTGIQWYEDQPLEKDAKSVAQSFVINLKLCQDQ